MSSDLLDRLIPRSETLKNSARDDENLDIPKVEKTCLGVSECESINGVEVRIGCDPKGHNCAEHTLRRLWRVQWPEGLTKCDG